MIFEIGQTVRRHEYDRLTAPIKITSDRALEYIQSLHDNGLKYEIVLEDVNIAKEQ